MEQIFSVEWHIRKTGVQKALLIGFDRSENVVCMVVQNNSDQVFSFREILASRFVNMKI